MAPTTIGTTIAIHKNADGIDPISPLPVRADDFQKSNSGWAPKTKTRNLVKNRFGNNKPAAEQGTELDELKNKYEETKVQMEMMKRQKSENDKRLLEMSGLVKSLHGIPVEYEKSDNNFENVQRKIQAIMCEMDEAKKRYDELRNEKFCQNDTIVLQEDKIKKMEEQITLLTETLKKEEREQKEQKKAETEELNQKVLLQEMEIMNLTGEIDQLKKSKVNNAIGKEISKLDASNAEKMAALKKMEEQLANMQKEQDAQKTRQQSIEPSSGTFKEINKLEDDLAVLKMEQTKAGNLEHPENLQILPVPQKPRNSSLKSQPWNRDLEWKDNLCKKKTELEVVAAADDINFEKPIESEATNDDPENILTLPSFEDRSLGSALVRKKTTDQQSLSSAPESTGIIEVEITSNASEDIENSSEEVEHSPEEEEKSPEEAESSPVVENSPEEIQNVKDEKEKDDSDTSATGTSSSSSFSTPSQLATKLPSSDDEVVSKPSSDDDSISRDSQLGRVSHDGKTTVSLVRADDGSIEAVNCTTQVLKPALSHSFDDGTVSSGSDSSSGSESSSESDSSSASSSSDESSSESSSGMYSVGTSTQSSSGSILEPIQEVPTIDTEDSDWEAEESEETKEKKADGMILQKQLKESENKYIKLMDDYKQLVTNSQLRMDKLEEDNQKLREEHGAAKKSIASNSEKNENLRHLKGENSKLIRSLQKQHKVMEKAGKNYEKLKKDHSKTLAELENKKKRYDQLIMDFSNLSKNNKNNEDYNRLKALHEAVVLKLADMSEDNERLEEERDKAIEEIESMDVKLRAYDEAIASLNKTEFDLKMLEEVHKETIEELQDLRDKNKELKDLYEKAEFSETEKLKEDYAKIKAEVKMLSVSNKQLVDIEEKLKASEVKVTTLEEEAQQTKEKLLATKKTSKTRADQLKDVIAQYKALKQDYSEKCDEYNRLKLIVESSVDGNVIEGMKFLEEALQKAQKDAAEAKASKEAREKDMKIVLQHYEKLQQKWEKSNQKPFDESESESEVQSQSSDEAQELRKLLKESKEKITSKDDKIAKTLTELEEAREAIVSLETQRKEARLELSEAKSKLALAEREVDAAQEKQGDGQDKSRTAVASQHQLQQVYDSLLKKFEDTQGELKRTKTDLKVKEEEEKQARQRATAVQTKYEKLQEDHDVVVQKLEKLEKYEKEELEKVEKEEPEKIEKERLLADAEC